MRIDSSQKACDFFKKHFSNDVEEFWIAALNSHLQVIEKKLLFRGTVDSCLIHPRDVIRFLCLQNASSFVVAHNHPSGDPRPSKQDIEITKRLYYLTRVLEIPLFDHVIISENEYYSFADFGLISKFRSLKLLRLAP